MKLSNTEINTFFEVINVDKGLRNASLDFINLIVLKVAEHIPWQNISMIKSGLGKIPSFENIKESMLLGEGGICLDINRFMFYFLKEIGFDIQYILCGRYNAEKRHIALVIHIENNRYFVDFGDAQPYYQSINLDSNSLIKRGAIEYKIDKTDEEYHLQIKKDNKWRTQYIFDLQKYDEVDFSHFIKKYYTDIFFGPFWKAVHFAYYPNKKLRAIKGMTILFEKNDGEIVKLEYYNIQDFNKDLPKYFSEQILNKFEFSVNIKRLQEINLLERFGVNLTQRELNTFLAKIEVQKSSISIKFIENFIQNVLHRIPFQNFKMIERGFGSIPTEEDLKEDMLSLNGGTCATINTFIAAVLYKIGFSVSLIHGTMMKNNDHIAILLHLKNKYFTIDLGDGQPYFEPIPTDKEIIRKHPFRTYRTKVNEKELQIDFLIKENWSTDVTLHLIPKNFKQIYKTLEQHYTQKEFGPFWKGVRFAIYPDKRIIAIRDKIFILQKSNTIEKIEIKDKAHLAKLVSKYLPDFREQITQCFTQLKML